MILHLKHQTIDQIHKEFKELESFLRLDHTEDSKFDMDIIIKRCSIQKK